jgi:hypothetical protein
MLFRKACETQLYCIARMLTLGLAYECGVLKKDLAAR